MVEIQDFFLSFQNEISNLTFLLAVTGEAEMQLLQSLWQKLK